TGINQLWAADITYIRLVQEFIYLAVIIDVFSRKCIGWKLSRDIDAELTLAALDMALADRKDKGIFNLIHHSDQGVQYASWKYVDRLKENGIKISMSRKGNPYDNHYASYCTSSILSVTFSILDRQAEFLCFAKLIGTFSPGSS
ncbi:MAG: IS3 family transposase, partial [ANME-2 cluster archaeon]